jgi:hypothetical protein
MNPNRIGQSSTVEVQHNGEFTSRLLQQRDWQREALRLSEQRRVLHINNGSGAGAAEPAAPRRLPAALGSALVRIGMRLQGQASTAAPTPAL